MKTTRFFIAVVTVILVAGALPVAPARADPFGEAVGGAAVGALFGAIIGGGDGAAAGAAIGGGAGLISGSARENERRRQQRRHRRQMERMEWERRMRTQEQALAQQRQQAWARSQPQVSSAASGVTTEIQKSLIRLGFNPGGVDGRLGPQTAEAIRAYQRSKGLLEDGRPSQELLRHMLQNGG